MTINGKEISTWGGTQHNVSIGHHEITRNSTWIHSAILPHFGAGYVGFKQIDIDVMVHADGREEAVQKSGDLLAELFEGPATIRLDGFTHTFKCALKTWKLNELVMRRLHRLSLTMIGYEHGAEVSAYGVGSVSVTNPGNIMSPAVLEITPSKNAADVTVTGLCRNQRTGADLPVTLDTVEKGTVILLDGANGIFKEGEKLKADLDVKAMPGIGKGPAVIVCSDSAAVLNLRVLPLYM